MSTFKIVISSDNHLGYLGHDTIRKDDSFRTFEETLQYAKKSESDFLLLGGDLFHQNRPTQPTIHKCLQLLRKYCLGSRKIDFEIVSEQSLSFEQKTVNYEDPNYKVTLPVFSVHGNHDDPTGMENISVMDVISTANFVNYFGKIRDISRINIYPILMQKGKTKIALYGLGAIKDERLHRLFLDKKVRFVRPAKDKDSWFNIFVLHQNRYKHSYTQLNYIPENFIPPFMHLVIWGHEHESIMELNNSANFKIIQPGSTVRTSLSKNEFPSKHIGELKITGLNCTLKAIPLKSIRPFAFKEIFLSEIFKDKINTKIEDIEQFLIKKTEKTIMSLADKLNMTEEEMASKNNLPLIRLRVEFGEFEVLNSAKFGQRFASKVANPHEILLFFKKAKTLQNPRGENLAHSVEHQADSKEMSSLILKHINKSKIPLSILPEKDFITALSDFVEKAQYASIEQFVEKSVNNVRKEIAVAKGAFSKEQIQNEIRAIFKQKILQNQSENSGHKNEKNEKNEKNNNKNDENDEKNEKMENKKVENDKKMEEEENEEMIFASQKNPKKPKKVNRTPKRKILTPRTGPGSTKKILMARKHGLRSQFE